jgi:methionine-rich copper-binding protein CopC
MQVENDLRIRDFKIVVNSRNKDVSDGDTVKDLQPSDKLTVTIEAQNDYNNGQDETDISIESIAARVVVDDPDVDVDEDIDFSDLDAEERDTSEMSFTLADDLSEGTYKLVVELTGEDQFGSAMGETYNIDLKVERQTHDIKIVSATMNPSSLPCEGSSTLTVKVNNVGKSDEDETAIQAKNAQLGLLEKVKNLDLREDDTLTRTFNVKLPDKVKEGTYVIEVSSMYRNDIVTDSQLVDFLVKDCVPVVKPTPTPVVTPKPAVTPVPTAKPAVTPAPVATPAAQIVVEEDKPFTQSLTYVILLIVATLVLAVVGVVIIIKLIA